MKLFMLLLGCKPPGRNTEQHDIFFSIGKDLKEIVPDILQFWPDAGTIHIDAWRTVTKVDEYCIDVFPKEEKGDLVDKKEQLFFLNLGGYKPGEFEEYHYKILVVSKEKSEAINSAKQSAFYKHTGFSGAVSHIDDKYGVDIDDVFAIADILPEAIKQRYSLQIRKAYDTDQEDEWNLGYTILSKL